MGESMRSVSGRWFSAPARTGIKLPVMCAMLIACTGRGFGQSTPKIQRFPLANAKNLVLVNVEATTVKYKGRRAVCLTNDSQKDGFALLRGANFQDGTIEADIALKVTTPPGVRMPGFVGIAFRARADASRYELIYLRPGNANSEDQAMRNHSVQYVSVPGFDWYELRRKWPWVYESYADLHMQTWMHVKIEVRGRDARLYIDGADSPSLIVDGLKGEDLRDGVALWPYPGEQAYFSNVRIINASPLPIDNGSDAAGTWQVKFASDAGTFGGVLHLRRDGDKLAGTWTGSLGKDRAVSGTWRNGYVELSFSALWPGGGLGTAGPATAILAG